MSVLFRQLFLTFVPMKKRKSTAFVFYTLFIFFIIAGSSACTYKSDKYRVTPLSTCDTSISYSLHIDPLMRTYCTTGLGPGTGCHDAWILTYTGVKGKLEEIKRDVKSRRMPPSVNNFGISEMLPEEIEQVVCWIENGAKNN